MQSAAIRTGASGRDRVQAMFNAVVAAEAGRFALWLPVAMTAGVVAYFMRTSEPDVWAGAFGLGRGLVLAVALRNWRGPRAVALLLAAASLGFASAQLAAWREPGWIEVPTHATIVTGVVRAVEPLPVGRRVLVQRPRFNDGPALPRTVRIKLRGDDTTPLATGDTIRVRAMLSRPSSPSYPGGWDLQRDDFFVGLGAYGRALNPSSRLAEGLPASGLGWVQALREAVAGRINAAMSQPQASIAATLMTGLTASIPPPDRAAFRDSGLAHLLAIAGLHIGIVMGLFFGVTRWTLALSERAALFWPLKTVAAVSALVGGFGYLMMTGAHVPIIRSFAMACLVTLGVIIGRRAISLRGLGLAMAAIVLIAPSEVMGVSFQMSFSAVLALIVGYDWLRPWLRRLRGIWSHLTALALTSALAGTFSAPYGAYHFGHVQIYFILANMIAVPITASVVMPAGLLALALMPLHLEALALAPMGWGITAILWIAHRCAELPAATLAVDHIPPWGLAAFSLGLAWLGLWRTRLRLAGVLAIILGVASPAFDQLPDVLVSADGRLIGYHSHGQLLLVKTNGGSAFTQDAWQQYWNTPTPVGLDCPSQNCLLQARNDGPAAILLRGAPDDSLCSAALLIAAEPIRLRCHPPVAWVDRFSVWRDGAHAIWLGPGAIRVLADRTERGDRPWVIGLPTAGRVPPGTVTAKAEELPPQ